MKKAIYAGSFDPFSIGHFSILLRALDVFDEVSIVIANNPDKKSMFLSFQRVEILLESLNSLPKELRSRIRVEKTDGFVYRYAQDKGIMTFVRGMRNGVDLEHETTIQEFNYKAAGIETIYFMPHEYLRVSSSLIREYIKAGEFHLAGIHMPPPFHTEVGQKWLMDLSDWKGI